MSKNFELKKQVVSDIAEKLRNAKSLVIVDYRGMTVAQVTDLRSQFRAAGVEYVVLKNTLVRRALHELNIEGLDNVLEGPSAFAFGISDPVAPAKVIMDYIAKSKSENLKVKAGLVDGAVIDIQGIKALSELPPKEVLIAKLMGSLNAPISGFVGVLSATLRSLVYAIEAVRKQKAGEE